MRDPNIGIPWHSIRIPSIPQRIPPGRHRGTGGASSAVAEVDEMEGEGIFNSLEFHQSSFFVFFSRWFLWRKNGVQVKLYWSGDGRENYRCYWCYEIWRYWMILLTWRACQENRNNAKSNRVTWWQWKDMGLWQGEMSNSCVFFCFRHDLGIGSTVLTWGAGSRTGTPGVDLRAKITGQP